MSLSDLSPRAFEGLIAQYLRSVGFATELTRPAADGGIDIIASRRDPFFAGRYVIQCKRWLRPVGEETVRDLYGTVTAERANKGILISSGAFTKQARAFAEGKPLELIDGAALEQLVAGLMGASETGPPALAEPRFPKYESALEAMLTEHVAFCASALSSIAAILDAVPTEQASEGEYAEFRLNQHLYDVPEWMWRSRRDRPPKRWPFRTIAARPVERETTPIDEIAARVAMKSITDILKQAIAEGADLTDEFAARVVRPLNEMLSSNHTHIQDGIEVLRWWNSIYPPAGYQHMHLSRTKDMAEGLKTSTLRLSAMLEEIRATFSAAAEALSQER